MPIAQIGDIVRFADAADARWVVMGSVSSADGSLWWGLLTKSGSMFRSAHRADTALELIERPTFEIGEMVKAVDQIGQIKECEIVEFRESGHVVRVRQPATEKPLHANIAPGNPPAPEVPIPELKNVNVAIDEGVSDVPLGMIVVRNRL
jgi:hypothetical protein